MNPGNDIVTELKTALFKNVLNRHEFETRYKADVTNPATLDELCRFVKTQYVTDMSLKDGYSRIAMLLLANNNAADAINLWEDDRKQNRISWWQEFRCAEAIMELKGIEESRIHIESIYKQYPTATNGFASLGWRLMDKDAASALDLFRADDQLGHLTPGFRLNYAVALSRQGQTKESEIQIDKAYNLDANLKDGFVRAAWAAFGSRPNERIKALPFFERDFSEIRMTPAHMLTLAQLRAENGTFDSTLPIIEQAYKLDSSLRDGYARAAWAAFGSKPNERIKALPSFEKDFAAQRLSPAQMLTLAQLRAENGNLDAALPIIEQAYNLDANLKDGYARAAWAAFGSKPNERLKALTFFEKDYAADRLSPAHMLALVQLRAQNGNLDSALPIIEQAYNLDSSLRDGYARAAWAAFGSNPNERIKALPSFEKDFAAQRLSPAQMLTLAQLLALNGKLDSALPIIEQAYNLDSSLSDGYARAAWAAFASKPEQHLQALPYFEKDYAAEKLSPAHMLTLAQLRAENGNFDSTLPIIDKAYNLDANLKDGLSRIAGELIKTGDREKALVLLLDDFHTAHQSPGWMIRTATILSETGDIQKAQAIVAKAYQIDPTLKDGYTGLIAASRTGCPIDTANQFLPKHILQLVDMDLRQKRLSPKGRQTALHVLRQNTMVAAEIALAEERYSMDLASQWNHLESLTRSGQKVEERIPILNAKLKIVQASDILVQFREIILHEQYRFETTTAEPVIIDGGADAGVSIAYFKWRYPTSHIIAFEPNPAMFKICQSNIQYNGWTNVTLLPYALSDTDGDAQFNVVESMPMASTLTDRLPNSVAVEDIQSMVVQTRRLSSFLNAEVDFMKLDIEGMERKVIDELGIRIRLVRSGFIEYHYDPHSRENSLVNLLHCLDQNDYFYAMTDQPGRALNAVKYAGDVNACQNWSCGIFITRRCLL